MTKTEGLIAAPLTPFHPDGAVNLDIIPAYLAFLRANGIVGVFINGTTGEGFSLSVEDRMALAEQWVKAAVNPFKVIVHVSHTHTGSAAEMARHAARIGAGGVGEMGPVVYRPDSVEALADHAAQTAAEVPELDYYYYHIPSISGICLPMIDFLPAAMSRIPNLAGIKYSHDDLVDCALCHEFEGGRYDMLYGRDELLLCALVLGCRGAVGSTYNIMAPLYARLRHALDAGHLDEAGLWQRFSMKVVRLLAETKSFNAALKAVMKELGLDLGGVRSPLRNIDMGTTTHLLNGLKELGFFDCASKRPAHGDVKTDDV
ncbi:MAG: dihydrodipicolinate synthase family protein [Planctomycetes bacterium]|nr:dihydrodipicolinate synthase family protein [Planctomycetota bacterium]